MPRSPEAGLSATADPIAVEGPSRLPGAPGWLACTVFTKVEGEDQVEAVGGVVVADAGALAAAEPTSQSTGQAPGLARANQSWLIREDGAGRATRPADDVKAWPGLEHAAVPPDRLAAFTELLDPHRLRGAVCGTSATAIRCSARCTHPTSGHCSIRSRPSGPDDGFNPGIITRPLPIDAFVNVAPGRPPLPPASTLAFAADCADLARATRRCVGVGKCQRSEPADGVTCLSYRVSRDEQHSTLSRARVLYGMTQGEVMTDGWRSTGARDAWVDDEVLTSGCCGQASNDRFEAEHWEVLMAMGKEVLPAVRAASDTNVLAVGFSGWTQIDQLTSRAGSHPAQLIAAWSPEAGVETTPRRGLVSRLSDGLLTMRQRGGQAEGSITGYR